MSDAVPSQNSSQTVPEGQGQAPKPSGIGNKAKRRVKNYLLQPILQVKLGLYCIILSILFAVSLGAILYTSFGQLISQILLLTDAEEEVRDIFLTYWKATQLWLYLCVCVYLMATVGVSVLYTHKLVGPTIAFRRHIRNLAEGRHNARTYLRKGDAFFEVADELNNLSEVMEHQAATKDGAQA